MLIITTNYIERLNETFIQSNYINKKFEFQLVDKKTIVQLFRYIFLKGNDPESGKIVENFDDIKRCKSNRLGLKKSVEDRKQIELLTTEFIIKMFKYKFNSTEIISFLLTNKQSF